MFSYLVASRSATRSDHLTDSVPLCLDTPRPEHTSGTCQSTEWKLTRRTGSAGCVASDGSRHSWSGAVGNTHTYAYDTPNDVSFPRDASTVAPDRSGMREAGRPRLKLAQRVPDFQWPRFPRHAWTPPAPGYRDNSDRTSLNYREPGREPARDRTNGSSPCVRSHARRGATALLLVRLPTAGGPSFSERKNSGCVKQIANTLHPHHTLRPRLR